jgi:hypothetical protein
MCILRNSLLRQTVNLMAHEPSMSFKAMVHICDCYERLERPPSHPMSGSHFSGLRARIKDPGRQLSLCGIASIYRDGSAGNEVGGGGGEEDGDAG